MLRKTSQKCVVSMHKQPEKKKIAFPGGKQLYLFRQNVKWVWLAARTTNQRLLLGYLSATLLESVLPAAMVLNGRALINSLVAGLHQGHADVHQLLPWLVLGAFLAISNTLISNLSDYWQQCLQDKLNLRIGLDILQQAARLDLGFLERSEVQDQVERARKHGNGLVAQVLFQLVTLVSQLVRLCAIVGILLWIEPLVIGWLCLLTLPFLVFKWRLANRSFALQHQRTLKQRWSNYFTSLLTNPRWLPEVKFFQLAPLFIERFHKLNTEFLGQDRQFYWRSMVGNTLFTSAGIATLYALFGRIAVRVFAGSLTVGDVAIYTSSTLQLQGTMQGLVHTLASLNEQLLHLGDLQAFLALQPQQSSSRLSQPEERVVQEEVERGEQPETIGRLTNGIHPATVPSPRWGQVSFGRGWGKALVWRSGPIEFVNVSFTYPGNTQPTLSNLSFCLEPGEIVALVGENGAGKSTLTMLLARLYEPTAGCIRVAGTDLRDIDATLWQQQIGFVFQKFNLYEATVRENIGYGNWDYLNEHPAAIEEIAQMAQAKELIGRLPQHYETLLGGQLGKHNLSWGQWQRLAIARGLARPEARLLILDEPNASLDARAAYELFTRFRQAASGRTTLLISHRFSTISMADRILVLEKGHLTECGTHKALLTQDGHYAMLYRLHRQQIGEPT